jgi:hypothetical protein
MLVRLLRLSLFLALSSCSESPASPGSIAGNYTLRQLNGALLPYDHEGLGCCTYLAGQLRISGPEYEASITAQNRNTQVIFTAVEWGSVLRVPDGRVAFDRDSFAISPLGLDTARVAGDTIRVGFGGEGPGSPDQFQALFVR